MEQWWNQNSPEGVCWTLGPPGRLMGAIELVPGLGSRLSGQMSCVFVVSDELCLVRTRRHSEDRLLDFG